MYFQFGILRRFVDLSSNLLLGQYLLILFSFPLIYLQLLGHEDGILLLEVDRMLRAGGYFVWAAQPVYKHEEALEEQWKGMI